MTLFTALILLPFAAAVQISLVIALAKTFDGDTGTAGGATDTALTTTTA